MEVYKNEYYVNQGEDWNLDKLLSSSNKEYIPYIISSERANPFFVVTVGSTKFEKNLRYVKSWWNEVKDSETPRFYQTVPMYCGELEYIDEYDTDQGLQDLPFTPGVGTFAQYTQHDTENTRYLYQYVRADEERDPTLGHKPYHYFYFDYSNVGSIQRVDNYECRLIFNFSSEDTQDWVGQDYIYQITLVSGILMETKLNQIYLTKKLAGEVTEEEWPSTIPAQYEFVKLRWPNALQPDIDVTSPLGKIENPEVILPPTKLQVFNNIRTII